MRGFLHAHTLVLFIGFINTSVIIINSACQSNEQAQDGASGLICVLHRIRNHFLLNDNFLVNTMNKTTLASKENATCKTTSNNLFMPVSFSFILQFNLSVGMIGLTYLGMELAHAVGIFSAGPITDKLVRHFVKRSTLSTNLSITNLGSR